MDRRKPHGVIPNVVLMQSCTQPRIMTNHLGRDGVIGGRVRSGYMSFEGSAAAAVPSVSRETFNLSPAHGDTAVSKIILRMAEMVAQVRLGGGGCTGSRPSTAEEDVVLSTQDVQLREETEAERAIIPPAADATPVAPSDFSRPSKAEKTSAPAAAPLGAELSALSQLDERLITALEREDIRLLRSAWLLAQPDDYHIQRRQELEEVEQQGASPSPLLSGAEAVDLVHRAARAMGVLS